MAKIFICGERLGSSHLGFLSIDGGSEQKIKANGLNMTTYECEVSPGKHLICFYTESPLKRGLVNSSNDGSFLGSLGTAANASSMAEFEYEVTLEEQDVLILQVIEKVTSTRIEHTIGTEQDCVAILENAKSQSEAATKKGCGCLKIYFGSAVILLLIILIARFFS